MERTFSIFAFAPLVGALLFFLGTTSGTKSSYSVSLSVDSKLPLAPMPADPWIDFDELFRREGIRGVLDPNSIRVIDTASGTAAPHALSEHFHYENRGRVQWVLTDRAPTPYEIRFDAVEERPPLHPPENAPLIGTGDLLRFNAGSPRPITFNSASQLADITGDGRRDLVGVWHYAYAPGSPWGGVLVYPGLSDAEDFAFGDLLRLRYLDYPKASDLKHFTLAGSRDYQHVDVADFNADGLADLVYTVMHSLEGDRSFRIYLNSGKKDRAGLPIMTASDRFEYPVDSHGAWWAPVRAVDLDRDGAIDFVVGGMYRDENPDPESSSYFLRNTNPGGWPIRLAAPVKFDSGRRACFFDVDGDGLLDSVCLVRDPKAEQSQYDNRVAWRRNLGGNRLEFGPPEPFQEIEARFCSYVSAVNTEPRGLLVSHQGFQQVSFYQEVPRTGDNPRFLRRTAFSKSAVVALGDQATPFVCDWDGDGDWDLLAGNGVGWVQILLNQGSREQPRFAEPAPVLAEGKPIRVFMTQVFPNAQKYEHNMGYPHPVYIDWNSDGLPDLMLPNLTNRIFWYENVGERSKPLFGPRRQVICDGYPDSAEARAETGRIQALGYKFLERILGNLPGDRWPDKSQPFFWRARAAFGDLTGDGLTDLVTADGFTREATLFVRYRDASGELRLRKDGVLKLPDGSSLTSYPSYSPANQPAQFFLADWNGDGLMDLIVNDGETGHTGPAVLINRGTSREPRFDFPVRLSCLGETITDIAKHGPYYGIGDLDGDGRPDILACLETGTYAFYRHTALSAPERPKFELGRVRKH